VLYQVEVFIRSRRAILSSFSFAVLFAIMQLSAFATGSITLAWNACTDPSVVVTTFITAGKAAPTPTRFVPATQPMQPFPAWSREPPTICGDNVCRFGHEQSVVKRGVLPDSHECPDCCSDCDLFKRLCRHCLHKPAESHEFCFQPAFGFITPHQGVDTAIKLEPDDMV